MVLEGLGDLEVPLKNNFEDMAASYGLEVWLADIGVHPDLVEILAGYKGDLEDQEYAPF